MSTRILANENLDMGEVGAVMFDGTTNRAFGPKFESYDQAEAFVQWTIRKHGSDPGRFDAENVDALHTEFLEEWDSCGLTEEQKARFDELSKRLGLMHLRPGVTDDERGEYLVLCKIHDQAQMDEFGVER